jgi:hypothetical protein
MHTSRKDFKLKNKHFKFTEIVEISNSLSCGSHMELDYGLLDLLSDQTQ